MQTDQEINKTDLGMLCDSLKEQGISWVRGGDDTDIQIIVGNKVNHFNADGSRMDGESPPEAHDEPLVSVQISEEFKSLTTPLIEWLNKNFHPHAKIIIDLTSAELSEGLIAHHTEAFLKG